MENAALRRGAGAGITGCLGRESTRDCNCERFYQFLDRPTAGVAYKTLDNVGIARLCFEVADIEEVAAYLASKGVEFVGPVSPYETAPGVLPSGVEAKFLCVRDPDGTVIEYAQFARDALDVLRT